MDKIVITRRAWLWEIFALQFKLSVPIGSFHRSLWAASFLASLPASYLDTDVAVPAALDLDELSFYEVLGLLPDPAATDAPMPEYVFRYCHAGYVHVPCIRDTFGAVIAPPLY